MKILNSLSTPGPDELENDFLASKVLNVSMCFSYFMVAIPVFKAGDEI